VYVIGCNSTASSYLTIIDLTSMRGTGLYVCA